MTTWATLGYNVGALLALLVFVADVFKRRSMGRAYPRGASFALDAIVFMGFAAFAAVLTAIFASIWLFLGIGFVWGLTLPAQLEFIASRVNNRDYNLKHYLRNDGWLATIVACVLAPFLGPLLVPLVYWLRRRAPMES